MWYELHTKRLLFVHSRRIDFREFVRDLFGVYKTRIWMEAVSFAFRPLDWAARALASGIFNPGSVYASPLSSSPPNPNTGFSRMNNSLTPPSASHYTQRLPPSYQAKPPQQLMPSGYPNLQQQQQQQRPPGQFSGSGKGLGMPPQGMPFPGQDENQQSGDQPGAPYWGMGSQY